MVDNVKPFISLNFYQEEIDPRVKCSCNSTLRTRWNPYGVLERVPANTPRIDYDSEVIGMPRGLLVERSSTNFLANGEALGAVVSGAMATGASIYKTGGLTWTVVQGSNTDERGVPNFVVQCTGVPTTTEAIVLISQLTSVSTSSSATWTGSLLAVKTLPDENPVTNFVRMYETDAASSVLRYTDTVATVSAAYKRYFNSIQASTSVAKISFGFGVSLTVGTTVSSTFKLGMFQLERLKYPTSFIPTSVTTSTTRAEELPFMVVNTGMSSFKNFLVNVEGMGNKINPAQANHPRVFGLSSKDKQKRYEGYITLSDTYPRMRYSETSGATFPIQSSYVSTNTVSVYFRCGFLYENNAIGVYNGHSAIASMTTVSTPSVFPCSLGIISFGACSIGNDHQLNGYIGSFQLYLNEKPTDLLNVIDGISYPKAKFN